MWLKRIIPTIIILLLVGSIGYTAERRTALVEAVAKTRGAVVNIRTEQIIERQRSPFFGFGDSLFDQFFAEVLPQQRYKTQSLGSGVIIDAEGHILTNAHVVDKASKIFVALPENRKELEARLIGQDNRLDLAVLKIIEEGEYPYLPPATSADLMLGEQVIAIGNPLGLGHSITTGIVSSVKRRIQVGDNLYSVFIQTDALINPGNSGGPLININGELVGINTAIARQAQGIGFSIPIDTARRVMGDLIEYGHVRRAFFGVVPGEVSDSFTRTHGDGGVLVTELLNGSPARSSGLQEADVILEMDGVPLSSTEHFFSLMQSYTPDDQLNLSVLRGLREIQLTVPLTTLPDSYVLSYTREVFGFSLRQGRSGLVIEELLPDSPAEQVGLRPGDLVLKVDNIELQRLSDYQLLMEDRIGKLPLDFLIVRGGRGYLIQLP